MGIRRREREGSELPGSVEIGEEERRRRRGSRLCLINLAARPKRRYVRKTEMEVTWPAGIWVFSSSLLGRVGSSRGAVLSSCKERE